MSDWGDIGRADGGAYVGLVDEVQVGLVKGV